MITKKVGESGHRKTHTVWYHLSKWKDVKNNKYKWNQVSWKFWGIREVTFEPDLEQQRQFLERDREDWIHVSAVQAEKQTEPGTEVSLFFRKQCNWKMRPVMGNHKSRGKVRKRQVGARELSSCPAILEGSLVLSSSLNSALSCEPHPLTFSQVLTLLFFPTSTWT